MLTVIGAGFPRTGTSSMKAALQRLAFGPCHHMFDVMTNPGLTQRWAALATSDTADWEHLFEGFRSAVDWPASHFWRELAAKYPAAKVILTVRDPHAWYASMQMLIANGPARQLSENMPPEAADLYTSMVTMSPLLDRMVREALDSDRPFREGLPDEKAAIAAFERHTATVKESLPPERLLVFDVREGWEPLCRFLGVDVPAGEPFPHLNDGKSMREALERVLSGGGIVSPFAPKD
ncbi:sulfotransferase family protein [Sphaerisporangium sp. NPDC004334]